MLDNITSIEIFNSLKSLGISTTYHSYQRGDFIYQEDEDSQNIFLLQKGLIGLFNVSEKGNETLLRVFSGQRIFGHRSLLAEEKYHASAIALSACDLMSYSKVHLYNAIEQKPEIALKLCKLLSTELREAELRLAAMSDKTAKERISQALVFLKLRQPEYIWTRKEISDFSGTTIETVARVMTDLDKQGIIKKSQRDFSIEDQDALLA